MRQLFREIDRKSGTGSVKLEPHDAEDMWHLYNLISAGDILRTSTIRKIQQESTTGSSSMERVRLTLTITVESVNYDPSALSIRVSGRVSEENKHVRIGAFHTVDLEPYWVFTLTKPSWDAVYLDRLELALDPATDADVGVIIMEEGLAYILLICRSLTITRSRIEKNIPRKGKNAIFNRDSAMKVFFEAVLRSCLENFDWDALKVVLIASPGFVKDEFYKFAMLEAARQDTRVLLENKSKILLCHSSSGHRHALDEVLSRPEVRSRLSKSKAIGEMQLLSEFHEMLKKDETRAVYGASHVKYARDMGAVDKLLITDTLFRSSDVDQRIKYVQLVEDVKKTGATVAVFSTQHVSGEQLDKMSGVVAILRFPLADLDDIDPNDTM